MAKSYLAGACRGGIEDERRTNHTNVSTYATKKHTSLCVYPDKFLNSQADFHKSCYEAGTLSLQIYILYNQHYQHGRRAKF
jgi:hypothetical protein